MLNRRTALTVLASAAVAVTGVTANSVTDAAGDRPGSGDVRFNQIQFVGAHNAYHRELSDKEKALQLSLDPGSKDIFYSHASIPDQLARQNVRSIELDLFPDPQGGLYQWPLIRKLAGLGPLTDPDLAKPGNKVLHIADFDYNTTCSTFVTCLRQVKTWQDANPGSAPVVVQVELKQSDPRIVAAGGVQSPPWNAANLDGVDTEIRSVFGEDRLLSPDDLRRPGLTLEQSVLQKGWPRLDAVRGKVMFFFDNGGPGEIRDLYTSDRPNLEGRAVFTQGPEGAPDAAVTMVNDPRGDGTAQIQRLVRKGYFVRTRSDESLSTVLNNETSRVGIALASGAQMVTTDFPVAGMSARYDRDFVVDLPGDGPLRCNPVTATRKCHLGK
jgi:hypothetical protein